MLKKWKRRERERRKRKVLLEDATIEVCLILFETREQVVLRSAGA
jgi:hypothetical protein